MPFWIAPMISLLPDIGLQRALMRVIMGQGAPRIPVSLQEALKKCGHQYKRPKESISNSPFWSKSVLRQLQICHFCGQVGQFLKLIFLNSYKFANTFILENF